MFSRIEALLFRVLVQRRLRLPLFLSQRICGGFRTQKHVDKNKNETLDGIKRVSFACSFFGPGSGRPKPRGPCGETGNGSQWWCSKGWGTRTQTCTFEGFGLQKHHQNSTRKPPQRGSGGVWSGGPGEDGAWEDGPKNKGKQRKTRNNQEKQEKQQGKTTRKRSFKSVPPETAPKFERNLSHPKKIRFWAPDRRKGHSHQKKQRKQRKRKIDKRKKRLRKDTLRKVQNFRQRIVFGFVLCVVFFFVPFAFFFVPLPHLWVWPSH